MFLFYGGVTDRERERERERERGSAEQIGMLGRNNN